MGKASMKCWVRWGYCEDGRHHSHQIRNYTTFTTVFSVVILLIYRVVTYLILFMITEYWGQKQTKNKMDHRLCHHGPVEEGACGNRVRLLYHFHSIYLYPSDTQCVLFVHYCLSVTLGIKVIFNETFQDI